MWPAGLEFDLSAISIVLLLLLLLVSNSPSIFEVGVRVIGGLEVGSPLLGEEKQGDKGSSRRQGWAANSCL